MDHGKLLSHPYFFLIHSTPLNLFLMYCNVMGTSSFTGLCSLNVPGGNFHTSTITCKCLVYSYVTLSWQIVLDFPPNSTCISFTSHATDYFSYLSDNHCRSKHNISALSSRQTCDLSWTHPTCHKVYIDVRISDFWLTRCTLEFNRAMLWLQIGLVRQSPLKLGQNWSRSGA